MCLVVTLGASPEYRFGGLLALARLSWIRQIGARMEQIGYPGYRRSDAAVLRLLADRSHAIGELGEAMGITRQAARQLAGGLVKRGYATLGTDPADARRTLVVLTPSGEKYTAAVWQAQATLNEAVRARVSAADLAAAIRVLQAVLPDEEVSRRLGQPR